MSSGMPLTVNVMAGGDGAGLVLAGRAHPDRRENRDDDEAQARPGLPGRKTRAREHLTSV